MVCCEELTIFCYLFQFFQMCLIVLDRFNKIFKTSIVCDEVFTFYHTIIIIDTASLSNIGCSARHGFNKGISWKSTIFLCNDSHLIGIQFVDNIILCPRIFLFWTCTSKIC